MQEDSHMIDPGSRTADLLANQVTRDTNHLTGARHPDRDQTPEAHKGADPPQEIVLGTQVQTLPIPEQAPNQVIASLPR